MAYDSQRGRSVLFGGYQCGGAIGNTWECLTGCMLCHDALNLAELLDRLVLSRPDAEQLRDVVQPPERCVPDLQQGRDARFGLITDRSHRR